MVFTGAFEVAVIRMCGLYEANTDRIIYGNVYVPAMLFTSDDPVEHKFITDIFNLVREMANCFLTESEYALLSALVLMSPGKL